MNEYHKPKKPGRNSSVVIPFSHDFLKVVTGYASFPNVRRFYADNFVLKEKFDVEEEKRSSRKYAVTALQEQAGIRERNLITLSRVGYVRNRHIHSSRSDVKQVSRQHFFVAVLPSGVVIPKISYDEGLTQCAFLDVLTVLQSAKYDHGEMRETRSNSRNWVGGDPNRTNPQHVIGLVYALKELQQVFYRHAGFEAFTAMMDTIAVSGINLDTYAEEIRTEMKQWGYIATV